MVLLKQSFNHSVLLAALSSLFRVNSLKNRIVLGMKSPLYITVGPQCAGKTTILQQLEQEIVDITLDDQRDVYVKVPTRYFLSFENGDSFLQTCVQRKTLASRIQDNNVELKAVLCRLSGQSTQTDFEKAIRTLYQDVEVAQLVITTVEEHVLSQNVELPTHIDLFCVESLFRPHFETRKTGIESAHAQLHHVAHSSPQQHVAWGNTNTRPREYKEALAIASSSNRPVHFVLYGDSMEELHLPKIGLPVLFKRNLSRLLSTGKYIPAQAMFQAHERSLSLVEQASGRASTKLEVDQELARMANFHMQPDRTVRPIPQERRGNQGRGGNGGQQRSNNGRQGSYGQSQQQRRGYKDGRQYRPQGSGRGWDNGGRVHNGQQQGRPYSDQGPQRSQGQRFDGRPQQQVCNGQPYSDQGCQRYPPQGQQCPPSSNGQRRERPYPQQGYFPPSKRQGNRDSY